MAGLFGLEDPEQQGLLSAALAMLAASGPSPKRTSVGQVVGLGGIQGLESYNAARLLKQRDEELRRRNALVDMQMQELQRKLDEERQTADIAKRHLLNRSQMALSAGGGPTQEAADFLSKLPQNASSFDQQGFTNELFGVNPLLALKMQAEMRAQRKPIIAGNAVLDPDTLKPVYEPTKEVDRWEQLDSKTPGGQLMQRNVRTGEIKPIGAGPPQPNAVSIQLENKGEAKRNVSGLVSTLQQYYDDLEEAGGAVKSGQPPLENAINLGMNTPPGQYLGRALGTRAQIARDGIASMRPALINEIRQATGMSARAMDSNVELQFNIKMATDPGVDPSINRAALERIDKAYGMGWGVSSTSEGRNKLRAAEKRDGSSANPIAPQGGLVRGQVVNGYMYLGGDPNNPSSWAKTP